MIFTRDTSLNACPNFIRAVSPLQHGGPRKFLKKLQRGWMKHLGLIWVEFRGFGTLAERQVGTETLFGGGCTPSACHGYEYLYFLKNSVAITLRGKHISKPIKTRSKLGQFNNNLLKVKKQLHVGEATGCLSNDL